MKDLDTFFFKNISLYNDDIIVPSGFNVKKYKPFSCFSDLKWQMVSFFRFYRWEIRDSKDSLICVCHTCPYNLFFPFMRKDSLLICKYFTIEKYRGKGYYPWLLKYIIIKTNNKDYYMTVNQNNTSSIRGIEKANFVKVGKGRRSVLGRFKISEKYEL